MHLCIRAFVHSCVRAFVHLCICAFVRSCVRAFVHLCICAFVHLCICARTLSANSNLPSVRRRLGHHNQAASVSQFRRVGKDLKGTWHNVIRVLDTGYDLRFAALAGTNDTHNRYSSV